MQRAGERLTLDVLQYEVIPTDVMQPFFKMGFASLGSLPPPIGGFV
jgi:hypothetical protein